MHGVDRRHDLERRAETIGRLLGQHAVQHPGPVRDTGRQRRQRCVRVLVDDRHRRRRDKRLLPGQHLVEDDAQAVDVAALVDIAAVALFRAHVVRRAEYLAGRRDLGVELDLLGEAEVDQHDRAVDAQHDVSGLQIAVQDTDGMDRSERLAHLPQHVPGVRDIEPAPDARAQVAGRKILHGDVGVVVGHAQVVDAHDVRVGDPGDDLVFLEEAIEGVVLLVGPVRHLPENLEDDQPADLLAFRQIDRRQRRTGQGADAARTLDDGRPEPVGALGARTLPEGVDAVASALHGGLDQGAQPGRLDLRLVDDPERTTGDEIRLDRLTGLDAVRKADDRREIRPVGQVLQPVLRLLAFG